MTSRRITLSDLAVASAVVVAMVLSLIVLTTPPAEAHSTSVVTGHKSGFSSQYDCYTFDVTRVTSNAEWTRQKARPIYVTTERRPHRVWEPRIQTHRVWLDRRIGNSGRAWSCFRAHRIVILIRGHVESGGHIHLLAARYEDL